MSTNDNKFKKLLEQVPTPVLLKAARERNREERAKLGRYAAQKKITACPICGKQCGVREMRRHKKEHTQAAA